MTRPARAVVLCAAAVTSGCFAYVRPGDTSSIPASSALATRAGQRLEIDEGGALVLGYAQGDVEAALGVTLEEAAGGVNVAAIRSSIDGAVVALEVGDVLLEALPYAPWLPPELVPVDVAGIAVRDLEDLRGLALGLAGLELGLRVRRGDREVVVRQPLRAPTVVATRPWSPELAARLGADLVSLQDWPASRLPVEANPEDYLVVRVQAGSAAGLAGLRPLDVVRNDQGVFDVRMGNLPAELSELKDAFGSAAEADPALRVTHALTPEGRDKALSLELPPPPRDSGFLILYDYEANEVRSHLGMLPFDWLFHHVTDVEYDALTDTYAESTRWSFLTIFQWQSVTGGAQEGSSFRIDPLIDEPRLRYAIDRLFGGQ